MKQHLLIALAVSGLALAGCDKKDNTPSGDGTPTKPNEQKTSAPHTAAQPGPATPNTAGPGAAPTTDTPTGNTGGNTGGGAPTPPQ